MEGSGRRERRWRGVEGGRGDGGKVEGGRGKGGRGDGGRGDGGQVEGGRGDGGGVEGKGAGKEGKREGERGEGREGRGERQSYMQVGTQIYENHTRNNLHKFKKFNSWDAYHLGPRLQGAAAACVSAGILSI